MINKKITALPALLVMGVLAGCNIMEGMGGDIERGGESMQVSARYGR